MSERGRARGRGRSRPVVPGEASSEPSGAAGITAPSGEVVSFIKKSFFLNSYYHFIRHLPHQL
jgi:hypothetical protein